jgi:hypothetical protein
MNPFSKKHKPRVQVMGDGNPAYMWHKGDIFTNGAEIFAFDQPYTFPLMETAGPGVVAGSLQVIPPPQIYQGMNLPQNPYQGTAVGYIQFSSLIDPNADTDGGSIQ